MHKDDLPEFLRLVTDVLAFYRQDSSEFALAVWAQACEPFDMEQVRKAMTAHATDPERGQFPPKPADIVKALQGTQTDAALLAWGLVYRAISAVGAYQSIDFGNAAIHAAVSDLGGWPTVCRTMIDDLPFVQKRFCDSFRVYRSRGAPEAPSYLAGESEKANALAGKPTQDPARIGGERARIASQTPEAKEAKRRAMEALRSQA